MALGETIALVRSRGFHIDGGSIGYVPPLERPAGPFQDTDGDDSVDLAAVGIDWDAAIDPSLRRRPRRLSGRRLRRPVA